MGLSVEMVIALEWKRDAKGVTESIYSQHVSSSKALLVSYLVVRERVSRGSRCGRTPRFESRLTESATSCRGDALWRRVALIAVARAAQGSVDVSTILEENLVVLITAPSLYIDGIANTRVLHCRHSSHIAPLVPITLFRRRQNLAALRRSKT